MRRISSLLRRQGTSARANCTSPTCGLRRAKYPEKRLGEQLRYFHSLAIEGSPSLLPELAKMMIAVEVRPAHPLFLGHTPEHGVRTKFKRARLPCKLLDCRQKHGPIGFELRRLRSAHSLFELRTRVHSVWPLHRPPQRAGLGKSPQAEPRNLCRLVTHHAQEAVVQVTNHLTGRHLSPAPRSIRLQLSKPGHDLRSTLRIVEHLRAQMPSSFI